MTPAGVAVDGVLVTHRWHDELERVVRRCASEVRHLYVVDNGNSSPRLRELAARVSNVTVETPGENVGIAAALNAGVRRALDDGADWILTMDHDTLLPEGAVAAMLGGARACRAMRSDAIGIIAPRYRIRGKSHSNGDGDVSSPATTATCRELADVITSANLVSARAFERAGLFDAGYFIDYVDFEFCLRVRVAGMFIVEVSSVVVDHRLGDVRTRSFLGATVRHTHYEPFRRYLKARNRVATYRRYATRFPLWVLADVWGIPWEMASAAAFEPHRSATLTAMLLGLRDGLLNRSGAPPDRFSVPGRNATRAG